MRSICIEVLFSVKVDQNPILSTRNSVNLVATFEILGWYFCQCAKGLIGRSDCAVEPLAFCSAIFEPKLNIFLFQFWKFLSVGQAVELIGVAGYQRVRRVGVVHKPEK